MVARLILHTKEVRKYKFLEFTHLLYSVFALPKLYWLVAQVVVGNYSMVFFKSLVTISHHSQFSDPL